MQIKKGCVYVISTPFYCQQNIYKIGFTTSIERRLSQFNNTRTTEDNFRVYLKYITINFRKLEKMIHHELSEFQLNNELFKLPLEIIENKIEALISTGCFRHHDILFDYATSYQLSRNKSFWVINLELYNLLEKYNTLLEDNSTVLYNHRHENNLVYFNDETMILYIKKWLKLYDRYNLYQFLSDSYYNSLLVFLKSIVLTTVEQNQKNTSTHPKGGRQQWPEAIVGTNTTGGRVGGAFGPTTKRYVFGGTDVNQDSRDELHDLNVNVAACDGRALATPSCPSPKGIIESNNIYTPQNDITLLTTLIQKIQVGPKCPPKAVKEDQISMTEKENKQESKSSRRIIRARRRCAGTEKNKTKEEENLRILFEHLKV